MRRLRPLGLLVVCALAVAAPRWLPEKKGPGRARITIYRIDPGKHLEFLKWMAAQDEINKEAGITAVQMYAHIDGDTWDYIGIAPVTTPEQDAKADEIAAGKGLKTCGSGGEVERGRPFGPNGPEGPCTECRERRRPIERFHIAA